MAKASRDKGARGELEVARIFTDAGLPAHRTAALQAGRVPGAADVAVQAFPGLHIETKRCETYRLPEWHAQVDQAALPCQVPVIAYRKSGTGSKPEPWRAAVRLTWLAGVLTELVQLRSETARLRAAESETAIHRAERGERFSHELNERIVSRRVPSDF